MNEKSSKSSAVAAGVMIIINLLSMILCIIIFAMGLLVIAAPSTVMYLVNNFGSSFMKALVTEDTLSFQLGMAGALVSGFVFCISFMGLYGAITRSKFLLFMKGFQNQDVNFNHIVRANLNCCELNVTSTLEVNPPWSCCNEEFYSNNCTIEKVHDLDCQNAIRSWLDKFEIPVYATLIVFHVILLSCSLLRHCLSRSHT
ncbi:unnamed protein product [Danaus chrysippus]|uniref:(African queen) hypothetical protein n=1 Tax=Danaus chrysippus TaxID=151541 RepID=A0A8J2VUB8_9NEOP|nr:unnamed protein product [Danaus chrysippus]